jgi:PEP-CTERM motif
LLKRAWARPIAQQSTTVGLIMLSKHLLAIAVLLAASTAARADSILLGTNMSSPQGGSSLCPSDADCGRIAQQFTLTSAATIDQIDVTMEVYNSNLILGGFTLSLVSQLGPVADGDIGSATLTSASSALYAFSDLNLQLAAGTYYLEATGGNVSWLRNPASNTADGNFGSAWMCDPTFSCGSEFWQPVSGTYSTQIDGTAITPEPSTFALLSLGIAGLTGIVRRRVIRP